MIMREFMHPKWQKAITVNEDILSLKFYLVPTHIMNFEVILDIGIFKAWQRSFAHDNIEITKKIQVEMQMSLMMVAKAITFTVQSLSPCEVDLF
ncbi:hypothetical protein CEXT_277231 [Caerostris extrusa]|uniref:Uncharacterized protein n=1 Tax=Caerostris extrusa TaxID=172846 RepID=A0AAV4P577_CAEEX|nr:hypothetical protein CEXT_277231 [Caerostris extrusa]